LQDFANDGLGAGSVGPKRRGGFVGGYGIPCRRVRYSLLAGTVLVSAGREAVLVGGYCIPRRHSLDPKGAVFVEPFDLGGSLGHKDWSQYQTDGGRSSCWRVRHLSDGSILKEYGVHCSNGAESVPRTALFMARARPRTSTMSSPALFSEVRCSKSDRLRSCKRPARGRVASLDTQTRRHSTFRYATVWQAVASRNSSIAQEFSVYELRA
jgi:hypothetical protein